ncbi:MAG: HD-GYP domain-containing protein, partial [Actinomycetales bacterium]
LVPLWLARWAYAQYAEQQLAYDRTIRTLVQAVEVKDAYTRGHSERVAQASVLIAQQLRMGEDRLESLRYAGILHDVGKLGVPTRLLQKTGRLSDDEFDTIKLHPLRGLEMVRGIEFLQEAYEGILHHHERIDGRGYPLGLSGTDIPEFARIIGVADAFDAMTTTRSYRNARPVGEALSELRRCAGEQFDPAMVEALEVAVTQHGWEPEVALVDLPSTTLPHQPTARDHDDPTFTTDPDAPRELLK